MFISSEHTQGPRGGDMGEGRDWPIKEVCDVGELHSSTIPRCSWNHPVAVSSGGRATIG